MNREYLEAITKEGVIELALLTEEQNVLLKEAIKEVAERTCDNCKYFVNTLSFCKEHSGIDYSNIEPFDFGCNKYEKK